MEIIELETKTKSWEEFLKNHEHKIFHLYEWKQFIEKTFKKTKAIYLAAIENNEIKTIFPFFYISHPIFRKKVISCSFSEYGGPTGDPSYLQDIIKEISRKYSNIADYLEIRGGFEIFEEFLEKNLKKYLEYKRSILPLTSVESNWKIIDKWKRKAINKADRNGILTREINENKIDDIYQLYLKNMKVFGSPPYSKKFFINFYDIFVKNDLGKCFGAYYNNELVSVLLGFNCSKQVYATTAVSDREYLKFRPNDAVHWHYIKWAIENNYKTFDFGRVSEDTGHFQYKKKWGCEFKDLNHYYLFWNKKEKEHFDPKNKKYSRSIKLWKKTPLFLSKRIGPWLREGMGI